MSTVLLDTNIVSFILKRDTRAAAYAPILSGNRLAISFMTAAELYQWSVARKWGASRIQLLEQRIASYLLIPPDLDATACHLSRTIPIIFELSPAWFYAQPSR